MADSQVFSVDADQRARLISDRYRSPSENEHWPGCGYEWRLEPVRQSKPASKAPGYMLHRIVGDTMDPELRLWWHAVLLEHPLNHPGWHEPAAFVVAKSQEILAGRPVGSPDWVRYANHWARLGFSPEMYALLHCVLQQLDLPLYASPERLAALQLDGKLGYSGNRNLDPDDWAELPALLRLVRPSLAVARIIRPITQA